VRLRKRLWWEGGGDGGEPGARASCPHAATAAAARLPTPSPLLFLERDLDDDGLGVSAPRLDESDDDFGAGAAPARAAPERARLRAAPDVGEEYAGTQVNAADVFGSDDEVGGMAPRERRGDSDDDGSASPSSASDAPSHDDALLAVADALAGGDDGTLESLGQAYAAADAAGGDVGAAVAERAARDAAKGAAVTAQRRMWEAALEARIMLQRAVAATNRLPRPPARVAPLGAPAATAAAAAVTAALDAIDALAERAVGREAERHGGGGGAAAGAAAALPSDPSASTTDALWARLDATLTYAAPSRDAAFDRWHRKAALLAGRGAALAGGLRVLDAPPSAQVAAALADPERLIARSRLPADGAPRRVGEKWPRPTPCADPDAPGAVVRDPDTFDDGEFYAQLLKEFVEAAGGGGAAAKARGPKRRKNVDRRASKGRKLRYDVHDKLVGFMARTDSPEPALARQLFGALFGGRREA